MKSSDRQIDRCGKIFAESRKISRDENPRFSGNCTKSFIGQCESSSGPVARIERQHGLVHLNPRGTGFGEFSQNLFIDRKNSFEQSQRIKAWFLAFAEKQERNWSEEHRPGFDAQSLGFQKFVHGFVGTERKFLSFCEL